MTHATRFLPSYLAREQAGTAHGRAPTAPRYRLPCHACLPGTRCETSALCTICAGFAAALLARQHLHILPDCYITHRKRAATQSQNNVDLYGTRRCL